MMSLRWLARFLNVSPYAFTTWVTARDGRRVKIGVPAGMSVGELEDQLHDRYWSKSTTLKEPLVEHKPPNL
jgi:hypothetical protein